MNMGSVDRTLDTWVEIKLLLSMDRGNIVNELGVPEAMCKLVSI